MTMKDSGERVGKETQRGGEGRKRGGEGSEIDRELLCCYREEVLYR